MSSVFQIFSKKTVTLAVLACIVGGVVWWKENRSVLAAKAAVPSIPVTVAVVPAAPRTLRQQITISSELVPFQQIDVYAKESGYVKQLFVDYGSHVKAGQPIATLEIPELRMQLNRDQAIVRAIKDQITHAQDHLAKIKAEQKVVALEYSRLSQVAQSRPDLVAQQEVDDLQGKELAAAAQVQSSEANLAAAQSQLAAAQDKRARDQVLFDYSKITAPFSGVITKRYANLGTLVQAGTNSSTQVLPIVRLSQENLYRLVIPVPEAYVRDIRVGNSVKVYVPALNQTVAGRISRLADDVSEQTRTMHTEVDVPNPTGQLFPGLYADATLTLAKTDEIAVPIQAVHRNGDRASVDVVDSAGRIKDRSVNLGFQTANYAAIDSGLQRGELVIVSDCSALQPGEQVRPRFSDVLQYQASGQQRPTS